MAGDDGVKQTDPAVAFFFVSYILIGNILLLNVVVAVLLDEFLANVVREKELAEAEREKMAGVCLCLCSCAPVCLSACPPVCLCLCLCLRLCLCLCSCVLAREGSIGV